MAGMSTFIEADHPRGHINNAGSFTEKTLSDPEVTLSAFDTAEDTPSKPTYVFPATFLGDAKHRIDKANARLIRAGIEERFTYSVEPQLRHLENGQIIEDVVLTLNTPSIAFAGWHFGGMHDFTPDGQAVHHYADPEHAVNVADNHCDHCGLRRARGKVFTVTNDEGETKQIGSNCLEAFLGIHPEGLWVLGTDLTLDDLEREGRENPGSHGSSQAFPAEDLIVAALTVSNDGHEFVSRGSATWENPSTAELVLRDWDALEAATPERRELAKKIHEWLAEQTPASEGDYIGNLKTVLAGEDRYVGHKHVALAVSVVAAYRRAERARELELERERRKANRVPGFLADVGEKIAGVKATIRLVREIDGDYGTSTLLVMSTEDGRTVKWFSSSTWSVEPGDQVEIKGTVKEHSSYEGDDQTVITRAKMIVHESETSS